uniref:Dynein_heavy domain-containing protein n=1 Tax=Heterorhabditis bacteriophora TaxID=37862 RepID=A0A1I7WYX7_HETBA
MDPVEAGDWLGGRPQQLIFLTGLDPTNRGSHSALRSLPTPGDDPLATERAHELCQICQLTPKQLFVLPVLGDLQGYVSKLESAFHDLAQGFYQQKLKVNYD